MSTQISIQLSDKLYKSAKQFAEKRGFDTIQDFVRELMREKLFEKEEISGKYTALASEKALAKNWLRKEEDEAWEHLQEET